MRSAAQIELKPYARPSGHSYVFLYDKNGRSARKDVHVLVLEAFVGPAPVGLEGCHEDGDSTNNRLSNLRWDTHAANMADMKKHGTSTRGAKSRYAKLTEEDVREIRTRLAAGDSQLGLAKRFGVSQGSINSIHKGRSWSWLQ